MVQYVERIDTAFAALADPTRRGIVERLGRGDASITDLASAFEMTLTGIKKHVRLLETAGLVSSAKVGRTRHCQLGRRRLEEVNSWIERFHRMQEARLDRLGAFLERTK
jgi:DNA-binding transcriptional ArsR family regulator